MMSFGLEIEGTDDECFVEFVQGLIRGAVRTHHPKEVYAFKIDHWFDHKWLGFSGKFIGAVGSWRKRLTIPPFVANRITAGQHYVRELTTGDYRLIGEAHGVHHQGPASGNLRRTAKQVVGDAALFWFSGDTAATGRGSLMGYVPVEGQHWVWYLSFDRPSEWRILKKKFIHDYEVRLFRQQTAPEQPALG